jgi:hypothetical protein
MRKGNAFKHQFVEFIPDTLEDGVIYISLIYGTVIHLCACGCKNEVITPLSPAQWKLTYDGESISLCPSIGNFNFTCQSHYWIKHDKAVWAENLSTKEIEAGRARDRSKLDNYIKQKNHSFDENPTTQAKKQGWIRRLWLRICQKLKI